MAGFLRDRRHAIESSWTRSPTLVLDASIPAIHNESSSNEDLATSPAVTSWSRIRSSCESNLSQVPPLPSELSASPAFYHGPIRQENIHMASDGRYFLLFDDNPTSEGSPLSHGATPTSSPSSSSSSSSSASALISPLVPTGRKSLVHRLVFPERLGRVLFFRRTLSDSDIYQKLCSKDNEIDHNVYHLDTIRDYSMEFYMLTTYASDSQLRAWVDNSYDDNANGTYYFDDQRFDSSEDEDDDEHGDESRRNRMHSSDSILREDEFHRLQADEELDWYSELESFNLMPQQQQVNWKRKELAAKTLNLLWSSGNMKMVQVVPVKITSENYYVLNRFVSYFWFPLRDLWFAFSL